MFRLLLDNVRIALRTMLRNPFRTFLVLQGMIWGAAVAIMPPALIEGSRRTMLERASQVGTDRVVLTADTLDEKGALRTEDVRYILDDFGEALHAAAPFRVREAAFRCGDKITVGWVVGTTPEAVKARQLSMRGGRFLKAEGKEAVLEPGPAADLGISPEAPAGSALDVFLIPPRDPEKLLSLMESIHEGEAVPDIPSLETVGVLAPLPPERLEINDYGVKRNHFLSGVANDMMANLGVNVVMEPWRVEGRTVYVPLDCIPDEEDR
ncbi:MAG: ABC transporter permease, partial [Planctomycetota bacterium]